MRVAIFARVSTSSQDTERQVADLTAFADRNKYQVLATITEQISGAKKNADRPQLQQLLDLAYRKEIDKVLVTEISRLGRDTTEILKTLDHFTDLGVCVQLLNYNLQTLTPTGQRDSIARMFMTMLADLARLERELIQDRVRSGIKRARAKGKAHGRKPGTIKENERLLEENKTAVRLLRQGKSIRHIAKICEISPTTVQKVKNAYNSSVSA